MVREYKDGAYYYFEIQPWCKLISTMISEISTKLKYCLPLKQLWKFTGPLVEKSINVFTIKNDNMSHKRRIISYRHIKLILSVCMNIFPTGRDQITRQIRPESMVSIKVRSIIEYC